MTQAIFAALLCCSLIGCTNLDRFGGKQPEPRPARIASSYRPAPPPAKRAEPLAPRTTTPLFECKSAACRQECVKESPPRWCSSFKKPT